MGKEARVSVSVRKSVQGYILAVQEGRFRMTTDEGVGLLLTLGRSAGREIHELELFQEDHLRVVVEYTGEPGFEDGIAHRVEPVF